MKQFNKETDLLTRISQVGVRDLDLFVIFPWKYQQHEIKHNLLHLFLRYISDLR